MNGVIFSDAATQDIDEISDYLLPRSEKKLRRVLEEIDRLANLHLSQPGLGRSRDDLRAGMKSFVVDRYLVFYLIEGDLLEIVRVLHGSRNIDAIMTEEPD